ncbi:MAG: hypothetical protein U5Q03_00295 [Bacteroidota bacterium]|nr:hypothetical protein [Bacteroidota bacterium]
MRKFTLITTVCLFFMSYSFALNFNADSSWNKQVPDTIDNFHSIWFMDTLNGFVAGDKTLAGHCRRRNKLVFARQ